jgi:multiple sugar transport system permease protein
MQARPVTDPRPPISSEAQSSVLRPQSSLSRLLSSEAFNGWLFISPAVFGLLVWWLGPVLMALVLSFGDADFRSYTWVGAENYQRLLNDELFWKSLSNTLYFVAGVIPLSVILSLLLAVAMNAGIRGIVVFRTIFFLPVVSSGVGIALLWTWIYNPEFGLLNFLLSQVGIPRIAWLASIEWAMPAIIIMTVWQSLGVRMVIFLAGLQGIPDHLYEAAKIDGANGWQQFRHITLPLLSPTTFFVVILAFIGAFQVVEATYVMTQGGPYYATLTIVLYIFQNAFQFFKMGYAAALSYVLFVIIFLVTLVQFALQRRWVHYE